MEDGNGPRAFEDDALAAGRRGAADYASALHPLLHAARSSSIGGVMPIGVVCRRPLGDAQQSLQRILGAAPDLAAEQQLDEPSPPPGRELEVSIEADERAAARIRSVGVRNAVGDVLHRAGELRVFGRITVPGVFIFINHNVRRDA